jgi:hypothetical protein
MDGDMIAWGGRWMGPKKTTAKTHLPPYSFYWTSITE